MTASSRARWFVRGDLDGFFGLALDNLVQLLVIDALCRFVLGFDTELLMGRVLPGAALSILVGNLYYARQAKKIADATGRDDICALPYGINTPSVFAFVFLVMLPVKLATGDPVAAWHAGLVACFGSGLIEFFGSFVAQWLRDNVPRAALLSTLAGIALTFISIGFVFRLFAAPVVGLATFAIVCLVYFGRLRFKGGIPGGLVAVGVGVALGWARGIAPVGDMPEGIGLFLPVPVIGDLAAAFSSGYLWTAFAVILPMGLFNVIGSLQNLESAEAAGDTFPTRSSLAANGLGTLTAAVFGSCFPTTIYIGHPGWKALGARIGYSWLDGLFMAALCLTGTLSWIAWAVPIEAGLAIVIWIGIVITAQSFQATPPRHAPAVVVGLIPGVAAWGALMMKAGARAGGGTFGPELGDALQAGDVFAAGAFSLEQGFVLTAMILSAAVVAIIDGRFRVAAAWMAVAAVASWPGLIHGWTWTPADTALLLGPGAASDTALGYGIAAGILFIAPWVGERVEGPGH